MKNDKFVNKSYNGEPQSLQKPFFPNNLNKYIYSKKKKEKVPRT